MGHSRTFNDEIKRVRWSIGTVGELYTAASSKIRYWCDEFEIDPPRSRRGDRYFTEETLKEFHLVYILIEKLGFTIPGARTILEISRRKNHEADYVILQIKGLYEIIFEEAFPNPPLYGNPS